MPPKKKVSPKSSSSSSSKKSSTPSPAASSMKTTATARKTASRSRAAPATLRAGGAAPPPSNRTRPAAGRNGKPLKPAIRKTTVAPARKRPTATGTAAVPKVRKRFVPPPPPPMYWICYDFTVKLVRGLCLGVAIGLVLTVVVPWMLDTGYFFYDKVQDGDLVITVSDYLSNVSLPSLSWNETSKKLWRVDQSSSQQQGAGHKHSSFLRHTPAPTRDPKLVADEHLARTFSRRNRTITVVHVGHTGGRSLMEICPQVSCQERFANDPTHELLKTCLETTTTGSRNKLSPLSRQAKHYFHLGAIQDTALQQSTTFLFTLRNPVDRMLAIFAEAHPLSCTPDAALQPQQPWGCMTKQYWNMPGTQQYSFYIKCFPQPQPEAFCQATRFPWSDELKQQPTIETAQQQKHDCRWMAREFAMGENENDISLAPHAFHNYEYYADKTVRSNLKAHEILAVRAEHEADDLRWLHLLMGGDGGAVLPTPKTVVIPTVSAQAYQKLCCVLHKEIAQYETILKRVANLPDYQKEESMMDLQQKCGIAQNTESMWSTWRSECENQLQMDEVVLSPFTP
ncbi:expressed unknown protein [Seminavis robusta]|uniref:Uncharacterized protein n=1 Tax=Seminavis robusta TaxID=568900 RepID=A0A9N8DZE6_9STRA|nr:expressed unknown protein [Seminavis robusta]|eukprot:Sro398_g134580.1 n/a (567) ;mRNA; f:4288-5988